MDSTIGGMALTPLRGRIPLPRLHFPAARNRGLSANQPFSASAADLFPPPLNVFVILPSCDGLMKRSQALSPQSESHLQRSAVSITVPAAPCVMHHFKVAPFV